MREEQSFSLVPDHSPRRQQGAADPEIPLVDGEGNARTLNLERIRYALAIWWLHRHYTNGLNPRDTVPGAHFTVGFWQRWIRHKLVLSMILYREARGLRMDYIPKEWVLDKETKRLVEELDGEVRRTCVEQNALQRATADTTPVKCEQTMTFG